MAVTPDGTKVFVANEASDDVSVAPPAYHFWNRGDRDGWGILLCPALSRARLPFAHVRDAPRAPRINPARQ
jgi:DNA-binding beta-propeller fold protein YncE